MYTPPCVLCRDYVFLSEVFSLKEDEKGQGHTPGNKITDKNEQQSYTGATL